MAARANRLAGEISPYLLQHAHNPVDWFPWGEEAFAAARERDLPLFLSIGYSTCHWCHVMERECFEDEEAAALLNAVTVPVKIDREERPDLDAVYMAACQMMTGSGGWPLSLFVDHELRPFFAATYIPKRTRLGRRGLMDLLPAIAQAWKTRRADVHQAAMGVRDALAGRSEARPSDALPGEGVQEKAREQLAASYDPLHGGFGQAPKFPSPHQLVFLLRRHARTVDPQALVMARETLRAMRLGGLFDHVGLGFHRYATDRRWLLPHFEKMLYDQAMLLMACTEAWQACGDALLGRAAREIADYVARELTGDHGGFLCAEDADSEGEEGRYYVWTEEELRDALGVEDAAFWAERFGFAPGGNYLEEATGEATGRNIPHLERDPGEKESARLEALRLRLLEARDRRVHPHKDDKVLTDWNGLMIAALAQASRALDAPEMALAAARAADFALANLRAPDGALLHRWREGQAAVPATLDDHAFLAWGLIELYLTDFDPGRLRAALELAEAMIERFQDPSDGGFHLSAADAGTPLTRQKQYYDAAIPSGNSAALLVLERLGRLCARPDLTERAEALARSAGRPLEEYPAGFTMLLCGLDLLQHPGTEVVVAARSRKDARPLLEALRGAWLPGVLVALACPEADPRGLLAGLAPHTAAMNAPEGRAQAFVCRRGRCEPPVEDPARLLAMLRDDADHAQDPAQTVDAAPR
ncbi:hypothetical protein NNJEOMEG_02836 [Fundidesulfovibrio magnetotacticus]|uniref:Spermatogenesis-associated protein 20-like TRX domain-containing protein n=1 Tax=Fundidesulfovibrio magnetotacticus TaxID=2730080 RepID=A0A6V8LXK6_9BACT|nr:thioredoxin domain-containing protein [Fundidesulfovibrio magnetotacticus]GFK94988.1 hypothetical protein NNJEOMEG_02836 [Fundidesulfovibrio magnetotacticus]